MLPFEFLETIRVRIPEELMKKYNIVYEDPNIKEDAVLTIKKPASVLIYIKNIDDISVDLHTITITSNTGSYIMLWKKAFNTLTSLDE